MEKKIEKEAQKKKEHFADFNSNSFNFTDIRESNLKSLLINWPDRLLFIYYKFIGKKELNETNSTDVKFSVSFLEK